MAHNEENYDIEEEEDGEEGEDGDEQYVAGAQVLLLLLLTLLVPPGIRSECEGKRRKENQQRRFLGGPIFY